MESKQNPEIKKPEKPRYPVIFLVLLSLGSISLISALVNILIHFEDVTVLVSKPFIALGVALIIIAFFYAPKKARKKSGIQ
ncbi:MAG: hypothetical protein HYV28_13310 [Ignavibacteriales bacterium]|nr:hypothetical protein [Ignavibacteriales bacterium]